MRCFQAVASPRAQQIPILSASNEAALPTSGSKNRNAPRRMWRDFRAQLFEISAEQSRIANGKITK
jgi:hypothetical protein